mmetsp:Transcript_41503/g.71058  ORF Transcript_41503/g.71058 Transcript_41503/m.71058 type:complete len:497 (-) Transcript_41503:226-1716(-)
MTATRTTPQIKSKNLVNHCRLSLQYINMPGTKRNHSPTKGILLSNSNGEDHHHPNGIILNDNNHKSSSSSSSSPPTKKANGETMGHNDTTSSVVLKGEGSEDAAAATSSSSLPIEQERAAPMQPSSNMSSQQEQQQSTSQSTSIGDANNSSNENNHKNNDDDKGDERTSKDYYFDSYSHHGIHEEMLKDEVRTRTYQMAIQNNALLFRDKIVLDVGCGTGILSMFAVQAGAKHVYAVDCSSIIDSARQIVEDNGMSDKITCLRGKMEEIVLPDGVEEVDIIVSEWMGYFLLYESMLQTVLCARDRWLRKDGKGVIFPDRAVMYLCAAEEERMKYERIDFWENVYGFDMRALKEVALKEPVVDVVDPKCIVTNCVPILNIHLNTCQPSDLSFTSRFRLRSQRRDRIHALVAYFECAFTNVPVQMGFSTSPFSKYTHWKQTIFYLKDPVSAEEGEELEGTISCRPNPRNERDLDIDFEVSLDGKHSKIMNKKLEYRLR